MCGLAGFYPKKNKKVDLNVIRILATLNEERGKHSCGISIGSYRKAGINKEAVAKHFLINNHKEIIENDFLNKPVIFHTRHATIGAHNDYNAHPFIWYPINKKASYDHFCFAHNGVISNTLELKNKFCEDYDKSLFDIDSHYLGLSVYNKRFVKDGLKNVLETYSGNAAFLAYDNNTFFAWKGAGNNIEERPLYYVETSAGWYFCSLEDSLKFALPQYTDDVQEVANNTLLKFSNNKLLEEVLIPRTFEVKAQVSKVHKGNYNSHYDRYDNKDIVNNRYIEPANIVDNIYSLLKVNKSESKPIYFSGNNIGRLYNGLLPLAGYYKTIRSQFYATAFPGQDSTVNAVGHTYVDGIPVLNIYAAQQINSSLTPLNLDNFYTDSSIKDKLKSAILDYFPYYYNETLLCVFYKMGDDIHMLRNTENASIKLSTRTVGDININCKGGIFQFKFETQLETVYEG